MKKSSSRRIYLDHASTTPIDKEVLKAMHPFLEGKFENSSALYKEGVEARRALDAARKDVAAILHAQPDEITFTGSGTEADNLAILGVVKFAQEKIKKPHIIISSIEHPAIMELESEVKRIGGEVTIVGVDEFGMIDPKDIQKALKPNTVLVSVMYANNEVGTTEPIKEIAKTIRHFRKSKSYKLKANSYPYFHTDASQAANYLSLNVLQLGVDLMTLDGSKIYGPKGVGTLYVKRGTFIEPIIFGGGQENGLRSGTENLAFIVGFAKAITIASNMRDKESKRLSKLRDYAIGSILKRIKGAKLNGHSRERLPNNINICFPNIDAEYAVIKADALGILCSGASSCRSLSENTRSYVLEAIGKEKCAESSLRFTLGRSSTKSDIEVLLKNIKEIVQSATEVSN